MVKADVIVFDMDGVLVDVGASYRDCIVATVQHFTGKTVAHERIQEFKNLGGFNNDWLLTETLCNDLGGGVAYEEIVRVFNDLFFGTYMKREKWMPAEGLLERLAARAPLYVFTGRLNEEAMMTLRNFDAVSYFSAVLGDDNVANSKPAPDGLLDIQRRHPGEAVIYLGDNVDDATAARDAGTGITFIGIGQHSGAALAIQSVNELEALLQ